MKLKLGKMTSKEVAAWLGITYNTYRRNIDKFLERLDGYATFEKVYGGIEVKEIFIESYDKSLNKKTDLLFLKEVSEAQDHLTTLAGITRKYVDSDTFSNLKERSIKYQFKKSRNKLFGETPSDIAPNHGLTGWRNVVWAIKLDDFNNYRLLTPEEETTLNHIIEFVYGHLNINKIKRLALLDEYFENNDDMSKEEYISLKKTHGLNFFFEVILRFREITGYLIVAVNKYEIINNFELTGTDQQYKDMLFAELKKDEAE